jgi:hypothetical protein
MTGAARPVFHATGRLFNRPGDFVKTGDTRQAPGIFHAIEGRHENRQPLHEKRDAGNCTAVFHATGRLSNRPGDFVKIGGGTTGDRNFSRNRQPA